MADIPFEDEIQLILERHPAADEAYTVRFGPHCAGESCGYQGEIESHQAELIAAFVGDLRARLDEAEEKLTFLDEGCLNLTREQLIQRITAVGSARWKAGVYWQDRDLRVNPYPVLHERYAAAAQANLGGQLQPDELTERVKVELGNAFAAGALWQHGRKKPRS